MPRSDKTFSGGTSASARRTFVGLDTTPPEPTTRGVADFAFKGLKPNALTEQDRRVLDRLKSDVFDVQPVLFATNRTRRATTGRDAKTAATIIASFQNGNRRELTYGVAQITIPKQGRQPGKIPTPYFTVLGFELFKGRENPRRHFTVGKLSLVSEIEFQQVARQLGAKRNASFLFVHGYNTRLESALFRTAQLAFDMKLPGPAHTFSWPSAGTKLGYLHDADRARSAVPSFLAYLRVLKAAGGGRPINIVAHSMGGRLVADALQRIAVREPDLAPVIGQVIFAAPDIATDVFLTQAPDLNGVGRARTIYVSSRDRALQASRSFAAGIKRLGEVGPDGPAHISGFDTIDVSDADLSVFSFAHSTFAERSHVITDLGLLIREGTRPPDRRFPLYQRVLQSEAAAYWRYQANQ